MEKSKIVYDNINFKQYLSPNLVLQKVKERKLHPKEVSNIQKYTWNNQSRRNKIKRSGKIACMSTHTYIHMQPYNNNKKNTTGTITGIINHQ